MWEGLLTAVANLILGAAGAIGGLAIASFTKFGDRLISYKLDQRLEAYKGGVQKDIEQLKSRLAHFSDRSVRANELEYEAITAAWAKLDAAYKMTNACIIRFYEHADLKNMNEEQLDRYFAATGIGEEGRAFIMKADDKNAAWARVQDLRLLNEAQSKIGAVDEVLGTKGIFIPKKLEDEFKTVLDICRKGWAFRKTEFAHGTFDGSAKAALEFLEKAPVAMERLKQQVRDHILAAYPKD